MTTYTIKRSRVNTAIDYELAVEYDLDCFNCSEVSLDCETTGLDVTTGDQLRLIQCYFPEINKVYLIDLWNLTTESLVWLQTLLEYLQRDTTIVWGQNLMFDGFILRYLFGVRIRNYRDLSIINKVMYAGTYKAYKSKGFLKPNSLKHLIRECGFDPNCIEDKDLQSSDWSKLHLSESQIRYAILDPFITYRIAKPLYDECVRHFSLILSAELRSIPAFIESTYRSLPCDYKTLTKLIKSYGDKVLELKEKLYATKQFPFDPIHRINKVIPRQQELNMLALSGQKTRKQQISDKPFNFNSTQQIAHYFNLMGYDIKADGKDGKDCTDKSTLFRLISEHPDNEALSLLAQYRSVKTGLQYLTSYAKAYDRFRSCIRTSYSVLATQGTGRSSSGSKQTTAVNCQNISKFLDFHRQLGLQPIRSFIQPKPGYVLIELDLAGSHTQIARFLSQDSKLIESRDTGIKLHYFTLANLLAQQGKHYKPEQCADLLSGKIDATNQSYYKRLYYLAKRVFFSFLNYSGYRRLQSTFLSEDIYLELDECKAYLDTCAETFSDLRSWQDQLYRKVTANKVDLYFTLDGEVERLGLVCLSNTVDGGIVFHNQAYDDDSGRRLFNISDIVSAQWLRPEATAMKLTLADLVEFQQSTGLDFTIAQFLHDSYLLEIKNDYDTIDKVMSYAYDRTISNMRQFILDYQPETDNWLSEVSIIGDIAKPVAIAV